MLLLSNALSRHLSQEQPLLCTSHNNLDIELWYGVLYCWTEHANDNLKASGFGSVGRAVTTDTRGPWFESSYWNF